jgi:hypothetical protein
LIRGGAREALCLAFFFLSVISVHRRNAYLATSKHQFFYTHISTITEQPGTEIGGNLGLDNELAAENDPHFFILYDIRYLYRVRSHFPGLKFTQ